MNGRKKIMAWGLCCLCASAGQGWAQGGYSGDPDSWLWYHEAPVIHVQPRREPFSAVLTARQQLKQMGQLMEEKESQAMLDPTPAHLQAAISARQAVLQMAQQYADAMERFVWAHPQFDYSLSHAQRSDRLMAVADQQKTRVDQALRQAAQQVGLFYVMRKDCPYCQRFSPLLHEFAKNFGFKVIAFSLDGGGHPDFPHPLTDVGLLRQHQIQPEAVPALYVIQPGKNQVMTVGFGLLNLMDLRRRLAVVLGIPLYDGTVTHVMAQTQNTQGNTPLLQ